MKRAMELVLILMLGVGMLGAAFWTGFRKGVDDPRANNYTFALAVQTCEDYMQHTGKKNCVITFRGKNDPLCDESWSNTPCWDRYKPSGRLIVGSATAAFAEKAPLPKE